MEPVDIREIDEVSMTYDIENLKDSEEDVLSKSLLEENEEEEIL